MHFLRLFWVAGKRWYTTDASRLAAAVAYFTPFALVPLLLISIVVVGWVTDEALFTDLLRSWGQMVGFGVTDVVSGAVTEFDPADVYYGMTWLATIFLGAMVVFTFNNLAAGLRIVWGVSGKGVWGAVETTVRTIGFFFLLQVFFVAVLVIEVMIPALVAVSGLVVLQRFLLFGSIVVLVTVGFLVLTWQAPSFLARLSGAIVVAIIFLFLRTIIDWWIYFTPAVEQYGGAGVVFALLVWIYVTTMVIFYGAAFAWAFDHERIGRPYPPRSL